METQTAQQTKILAARSEYNRSILKYPRSLKKYATRIG